MRILLVTQMWPSPAHPDLGSFLVPVARELEELGNEVEVAAISRRGGPRSDYARLAREIGIDARHSGYVQRNDPNYPAFVGRGP